MSTFRLRIKAGRKCQIRDQGRFRNPPKDAEQRAASSRLAPIRPTTKCPHWRGVRRLFWKEFFPIPLHCQLKARIKIYEGRIIEISCGTGNIGEGMFDIPDPG